MPILSNIYMEKLESLLKKKCKTDKKRKYGRFCFKYLSMILFGMTKANKTEFEYCIFELNLLRDSIIMDKFKMKHCGIYGFICFQRKSFFQGWKVFKDGFILWKKFFRGWKVRYICFPKKGKQIKEHSSQ